MNNWVVQLSILLGSAMELRQEDEYYLTTPISGGAVEIESNRDIYWRRWSRDHGMAEEEHLGMVPDVHIFEQAAWIRMRLREEEMKRDIASGSDEPKIYLACKIAQLKNEEVSHGVARAIALQYSCTSVFSKTGAIPDADLWFGLIGYDYNLLNDDDKLAADMLGIYIVSRRILNETGPVENWNTLRL